MRVLKLAVIMVKNIKVGRYYERRLSTGDVRGGRNSFWKKGKDDFCGGKGGRWGERKRRGGKEGSVAEGKEGGIGAEGRRVRMGGGGKESRGGSGGKRSRGRGGRELRVGGEGKGKKGRLGASRRIRKDTCRRRGRGGGRVKEKV